MISKFDFQRDEVSFFFLLSHLTALPCIRGIDTDPDKQQIVQNIVAYAHPRSMQIIAEGVETAAELRKVIELGADALQGYFLAKPAAVPAKMAPAARKVIAEYSSASDSG